MNIREEKVKELEERMRLANIREEELIERFILGSGSGGQKINKTSSCVYLKHLPTGIEVKCQRDRSRSMNRYFARRMLVEKIEGEILKIKTEKQQEREKIKRQKKRKSRRQKEKMVEEKRKLSVKKQLRSSPSDND